jgi:hypothetical protein
VRHILLFGITALVVAGCGDGSDGGRQVIEPTPVRDAAVYDSSFVRAPDAAPADADVDAGPPPQNEWDATPTGDARPRDAAPPPERDAAPARDAAPPEPDAAPPPPPDAGPPPGVDEACRAALARAEFTFNDGPQGWAHGVMDDVQGDWPFDAWEQGLATSGPGRCAEGNGCWATYLDDNLIQCQRAELRSPSIDLGACARYDVTLVFDQWYAFWSARVDGVRYFDGGTVEAGNENGYFEVLDPDAYPGTLNINPELGFDYSCLDGDNFHVDGLPGFVGQTADWVETRMPLGDLPANGPFRVRFAYATGVSLESTDPYESQQASRPGWYVDHVRFEAR